ncbi:MAG: exosortase A [Gammaproteobacteria bacterium]|nr:exosortase A [Gammaproteobacteria bacterium]MDH3768805.1 exosortase A [Gammaproteobacteria bacterium]
MSESHASVLKTNIRELRRPTILLIAFAFVVTVTVYWSTFRAMADIWLRSDTFAHGLIVGPIFLYLLFRGRHELGSINPQPFWPGLAFLLFFNIAWVTGRYLGVNALEQFAAVALIPSAVLTVAGPRVVRASAFPLLFLFFAVPFGEFLIPHLMEVTADLTTLLLGISGFPVYREGLFIAVPGGDFEIAKACSGIRYLIASVVLGTIFAYLTFGTWRKRLIFIVVSIIVPIFANGIRAYMIVVLASLSGMKLAVGIDHFIYGWVFFGIVMFVLFAIGVRFRDEALEQTSQSSSPVMAATVHFRPYIVAMIATLAVMLVGPSLLGVARARANSSVIAQLPALPGMWAVTSFDSAWQPFFQPSDQSLRRAITDGKLTIYEFVDVYDASDGGVDAASSSNRLVDNEAWHVEQTIERTDKNMRVVLLRSGQKRMYVASWYQNGDKRNASANQAKLAEAWDSLIHGGSLSAIVVYAVDGADETNLSLLLRFLDRYQPELTNCLSNPDQRTSCDG